MMGAMALCAVGVQSVVADDMLVEPTPTSVDKRSQPASVNDMLVPSLDDTRIDYLELRKDGGWFTSASVGNMFDTQEAYFTLSLGYHLDENQSLAFQLTRFKDTWGDGFNFGKQYMTSFGGAYQYNKSLSETLNVYGGGSLGIALLEGSFQVKLMDQVLTSLDGDSVSFYADATVGIEKMITQNWAANLGMRLYYLNDHTVKSGGTTLPEEYNNVYFGLELGVSYSF